MHASAASGRRPTIAPKGSDWVVQGKGPVRHVRDTARMRPSLRGGRVSAEGPQRRSRCAQKAHMARRKELAHKVNRPPRDARAGGVRQPRGEVRRLHGSDGRAQDDMASGWALVRRETEPQNIAPGPSAQLVPRVTRDAFSRQTYSAVPNARTVVSDALSPTGLPMAPSIRERIRAARSRKNDSKSSAFI